MLLKAMLSTPLGPMLAVASPAGLCGLEFDRPERATRLWRRLERWRPAEAVEDGDVPPFEAARAWLDDYFARRWDACKARDVALDLLGTLFERAVWQALETIDAGTAKTYGANPVSLIVPCHRVIGTSGSLTGYGGGLDRKEWLLRHEGALLL